MFFILLHVVLRASEMDRECCMQHFASDNALRLYEIYITYKLPGTTDMFYFYFLYYLPSTGYIVLHVRGHHGVSRPYQ